MAWRDQRLRRPPARDPRGDVLPQTIGHVSLALAINAYEQRLVHPDRSLTRLLQQSVRSLNTYWRI
jgi:hypothetical protein